jgi:hypothetical protein
MALNHFRPRAHRFGTELVQVTVGNPGPISPVAVASSTVIYKAPLARGRYFLEKLSLFIGTLAAGGGTILGQVAKRNSVGSVDVDQTATFDLETGSVNTARALTISATDAQRYFNEGDYLAFDVVASGTITQQPADLFVVAEFAVLE